MENLVYQPAPAIVNFAYSDYTAYKELDKIRTIATCVTCGIKIKGVGSTTSNFLSHVKIHKEVYASFLADLMRRNPAKPTVAERTKRPYRDTSFSQHHPGDPAIKDLSRSIAFNLILDSNAPINIAEEEGFIKFLREMNAQIIPMNGHVVLDHISQAAEDERGLLIRELREVDYISSTLNVWQECHIGWFVAVTAHFITNDQLKSRLLDARRLPGTCRPSMASIVEMYKEILLSYGISVKMAAIVMDNPSDSENSFNTQFRSHYNEEQITDQFLFDADANSCNDAEIDTSQEFGQQRVACFAHLLQLTVADGLKESSIVKEVLNKAEELSFLIYSSSSFREAFEERLGPADFPPPNETRWTSMLHLLKTILSKGAQPLADLCDELSHTACKFTTTEWSQLDEFVELLDLFGEAAELTGPDKTVPISVVLPTVLSLYNHVTSHQFQHLKLMSQALAAALTHRFQDILSYCQVINPPLSDQSTAMNDIFAVSTILDPNYALLWLDVEVKSQDTKDKLTADIKDKICGLAKALTPEIDEKITGHLITGEDVQIDLDNLLNHSTRKKPRLGGYRQRNVNKSVGTSIRSELEKYLHMPIEDETDPISFWNTHGITMPALARLARNVLSTPATSAPVWRLINQGNLLPGASQCLISNAVLSDIIFLKCWRRFN